MSKKFTKIEKLEKGDIKFLKNGKKLNAKLKFFKNSSLKKVRKTVRI